jgi:hypothetical protein
VSAGCAFDFVEIRQNKPMSRQAYIEALDAALDAAGPVADSPTSRKEFLAKK